MRMGFPLKVFCMAMFCEDRGDDVNDVLGCAS